MNNSDLIKKFATKIVRLGYMVGVLRIPFVQLFVSIFYTRLIYPVLSLLFPTYEHLMIQIDSHQFIVSMADQGGIGMAVLEHNTYMTALFRDLIKPGMCILDCGAYIGYYTVLGSELVGSFGKVIAVEPHPDNFILLQKNIELNKCSNVVTLQIALSDSQNLVSLFINKRDSSSHSMYPFSSKKCSNSILIKTIRADDICAAEVVDVVKIDVEGAELSVLRGMEKILAQERLILFIEYQPKNLLRAGVEPTTLITFLEERGFMVFHIDETKKALKPLKCLSAIEALRKMKKEQNLLCTKGIRHASLP